MVSLGLTSSTLNNEQVLVCADIASSTNTTITNNYDLTVGTLGISSTTLNNNGIFVVDGDFSNSISDQVTNVGAMHIKGDYVNSIACSLYTECTIQVDGDWVNNGVMTGPTSGCGGFKVEGSSANTGSIAPNGGNFDVCDTTGFFNGMDANIGTLGSNFTNCSCSNLCSGVLEVGDIAGVFFRSIAAGIGTGFPASGGAKDHCVGRRAQLDNERNRDVLGGPARLGL